MNIIINNYTSHEGLTAHLRCLRLMGAEVTNVNKIIAFPPWQEWNLTHAWTKISLFHALVILYSQPVYPLVKQSLTWAGLSLWGLLTSAHLRTASRSHSSSATALAPSSQDKYSCFSRWKMLPPRLPGVLRSRITEPGVQGRGWR